MSRAVIESERLIEDMAKEETSEGIAAFGGKTPA